MSGVNVVVVGNPADAKGILEQLGLTGTVSQSAPVREKTAAEKIGEAVSQQLGAALDGLGIDLSDAQVKVVAVPVTL